MILTGSKIKQEVESGKITIEPFSDKQVNPNSYNYRLGDKIKVFNDFVNNKAVFKEVDISPEGYTLKPGRMYLATTRETIGSSEYAMSLIGRSSMGRYGLFLQCSADLGHTTSSHKWTLEIVACMPIKVYPGMIIGQVSFWKNEGRLRRYDGRYGFLNHAQESFSLKSDSSNKS